MRIQAANQVRRQLGNQYLLIQRRLHTPLHRRHQRLDQLSRSLEARSSADPADRLETHRGSSQFRQAMPEFGIGVASALPGPCVIDSLHAPIWSFPSGNRQRRRQQGLRVG